MLMVLFYGSVISVNISFGENYLTRKNIKHSLKNILESWCCLIKAFYILIVRRWTRHGQYP